MANMIKRILRRLVTDIGLHNESPRDLWVKSALLALPREARLLDAGAGEQRYRSHCAHLNYVSQDFCQYNGVGDGNAIQTGSWDTARIDITSDITDVPVEAASFDAILCTEVFEHIPDPIAALREFHRILKPGGQLILTAPFCSVTHMAPYHYYSGFNRYFYEHHLPAAGFQVLEVTPNGDYSEYLAQELRRLISIYPRRPIYLKGLIGVLLRFLRNNRHTSTAKSELLCYGFHVKAVRL